MRLTEESAGTRWGTKEGATGQKRVTFPGRASGWERQIIMKSLETTVEGQGLHHEQELGNGHSGVKRKHVLCGFTQSPWGQSVWILSGSCVDSALELTPQLRVQKHL